MRRTETREEKECFKRRKRENTHCLCNLLETLHNKTTASLLGIIGFLVVVPLS